MNLDNFIYIDIETTGLDLATDHIIGIGCYNFEYDYYTNDYKVIKELCETKSIIAHNGAFDCSFINKAWGTDYKVTLDSTILGYLNDPSDKLTGLKHILKRDLKIQPYNEETLGFTNAQGKRAKSIAETFHVFKHQELYDKEQLLLLESIMQEYMRKDVIYGVDYVNYCVEHFNQIQWDYAYFLSDIYNIFNNDLQPYYLDQEALQEAINTYSAKASSLKNKLLYSNSQLNLNSSKQLVEHIEKRLGLEIKELTGKGAKSTSSGSVMEMLRRYPEVQWLRDLLEYRKANKLLNDFLLKWQGLGSFKPKFNVVGTRTGRCSCSNPNAQQIPRELKGLYTAPKGYKLIEADYSQIELRVVAQLAQIDKMLEAFALGEDLHSVTAREFYGKDFTKEQRTIGKTANFSLLYGTSPQTFHTFLLNNGVKVELIDSYKLHKKFHKIYPEIQQYTSYVANKLAEKHCVFSMMGRQYKVDNYEYASNRKGCERAAMNFTVQSLASDILLNSLQALTRHTRYMIDFYLVGTVHDSILLYVREDKVEEYKVIIEDIMCNTIKLPDIDIKVDVEVR
jgi:DNA polymerase I-like protein with 3'-5' exonuclease and polymerase domains